MADLPLHQLNPHDRFSDRVENYARYRPSYPDAAIDTILSGLNNPAQRVVADVGAGTGISARLLAARGLRVWAIEPNAAMRQAAEPDDRVTFQAGTAEETGLPTASVALVTCFQSFHWFDPDRCLPEFRRILVPGGRLAVVWNSRNWDDPFTAAYSELVRQLSNHHPAESRLEAIAPLQHSAEFVNVQQHTVLNRQELDFAGLVGRAQSVSYLPQDQQTQQQLVTGLQAIYDHWQDDRWQDDRGLVSLSYQTRIFLAEARS